MDNELEELRTNRRYLLRDKYGNTIGHISGNFGEPCADCEALAETLCDYPVGDGKTCDRHLCGVHGTEVAPDVHYCEGHFAEWQAFVAAGGVTKALRDVVPFRDPVTKKPLLMDHELASLVGELTRIARVYHSTQQLRAQIARCIRERVIERLTP
ncbi:MAG: hypothetical protein ACRDBJ_06380 [Plesiomonas shigelloides]